MRYVQGDYVYEKDFCEIHNMYAVSSCKMFIYYIEKKITDGSVKNIHINRATRRINENFNSNLYERKDTCKKLTYIVPYGTQHSINNTSRHRNRSLSLSLPRSHSLMCTPATHIHTAEGNLSTHTHTRVLHTEKQNHKHRTPHNHKVDAKTSWPIGCQNTW